MKIKLTSTGGVPLVMTVIAFLFAALGSAQEFIAMAVYEAAFKKPTYDYVLLIEDYMFFDFYGYSVLAFVMSFFVMIIYIAGVSRPVAGTRTALVTMVAAISALISPFMSLMLKIDEGILEFRGSDGAIFRQANLVITYVVPVISGLLLFFAGLALFIKCGGSKAVIFTGERQPMAQPQSYMQQPAYAASAPVYEQPTYEQPSYEQPSYEQPSYEQPAPVYEEAADINPRSEQVIPETSAPAAASGLFCPSCGKEYSAGAKFCRSCGTKLG